MCHKRLRFLRELIFIIPLFLVTVGTTVAPTIDARTIFVDAQGSPKPDGSSKNPFQLLETGICAAERNDIVQVKAGNYLEAFIIDKPITITSYDGSAVIGKLKSHSSTTLRVLTYNTHLFGKEAFAPEYKDKERAYLIAGEIQREDVDVIALQEVWDEEIAEEIFDVSSWRWGNGNRYYKYYSKDQETFDTVNSGLMLISKYEITNPSITFYDAEVGFAESFASKGFISANIHKDGFNFLILYRCA